MNTRTPFATISYNTPEFLEEILQALVDSDILDFYAYIWHRPEEDEKKPHAHVYMRPSKQVNTKSLQGNFDEIVLGEDKPRKILPCQSSKFDDWYLYSIHDPSYLASKGQTRKYHYRDTAVRSNEPEFLAEMIRNIDTLRITPYQAILDSIDMGMSWEQFVTIKQPNINQLHAFQTVWFALVESSKETKRNGHPNHEETVPSNDSLAQQ